MKLSVSNNLNINSSILTNFKNKDFFFNEFEKNHFFLPFLDKNYYKKYNFKKLVHKKNRVHVFGMGGSSLSSKLLIQFLNPKELDSKIFIYDNPYDELIEKNLTNHSITSHDKFIFISKSGKTAETKYFLNYVEKYLHVYQFRDLINR